jgi:hypothetical protein
MMRFLPIILLLYKWFECIFGAAGKQFKSVSLRNLHERRERGEKRFSCSFCQKKFANGQQKRNHERTHTGEKPYDCEHCGRMFAQKHQVGFFTVPMLLTQISTGTF